MLKANKKTLILTSIITALPIVVGLLLWNQLPDPMATHFGSAGADGYSSKLFAVVGLPLILVALEWVGAFATASDPRKQNISSKMFTLVLWIVPVISLVACGTMYAFNLNVAMNVDLVAGLLVGVMFIVVGNFLPKARQNYTIGIKIPWTLASEENWNNTHRLAGYLWMICGAIMVILTLCGKMASVWMMIVAAIMVGVPVVYSYLMYRKEENK